jgi:hypothetical protein
MPGRPAASQKSSLADAATIAEEWAKVGGIAHRIFFADRVTLGRAAGPIRNQAMIDDGKPDLVIAFPGGHGSADTL